MHNTDTLPQCTTVFFSESKQKLLYIMLGIGLCTYSCCHKHKLKAQACKHIQYTYTHTAYCQMTTQVTVSFKFHTNLHNSSTEKLGKDLTPLKCGYTHKVTAVSAPTWKSLGLESLPVIATVMPCPKFTAITLHDDNIFSGDPARFM